MKLIHSIKRNFDNPNSNSIVFKMFISSFPYLNLFLFVLSQNLHKCVAQNTISVLVREGLKRAVMPELTSVMVQWCISWFVSLSGGVHGRQKCWLISRWHFHSQPTILSISFHSNRGGKETKERMCAGCSRSLWTKRATENKDCGSTYTMWLSKGFHS